MDQQQILSELESNRHLLRYLTELSKKIPYIYRNTASTVRKKYRMPEARDVEPSIRRADIETALAELPVDLEGIEIRAELNKAKNCWHREVRSGQFVFTASHVNSPGEMVRPAEYRKTLAEESQPSLFGQPGHDTNAKHCYGILLHGKLGDADETLPFLRLAFPSRSYSDYLLNLDLYKYLGIKHLDIGGDTPVEDIRDEIIPNLKPGIAQPRKDLQQ